MKHFIRVAVAIVLCTGTLDGIRAQAPSRPKTGTLVVSGDVPQPATWTLAELKTLPRTSVSAVSEDGRTPEI